MALEFTIRRSDIDRLFSLANARNPPEGQEWLVFIAVEDYIASFQVGPENIKFPVRTTTPGTAEFPLSSLREITKDQKAKELDIRIGDAFVACGAASLQSDHIRVGLHLDAEGRYQVYPTRLELIVLGRAMDAETIKKLGLEKRFADAESSLKWQISHSAKGLTPYGVKYADVENLVNNAIKKHQPEVFAKLGIPH